jgi:histidinol-phosphate phosphatase family protein
MTLNDLHIDKSWTLFLDRDGVINRKLENDYVKHWVEFEFLDGAIDAIKFLASLFGHLIVVTNQQGIGKRIYRVEDLEIIHKNMLYEITYHGGRIDKVYFAPHLASENHPARKPGIGMALSARADFPHIDFAKSLVIGDSMSDMSFGRNAGMKTAYISSQPIADEKVDFCFSSLGEFVEALQNKS